MDAVRGLSGPQVRFLRPFQPEEQAGGLPDGRELGVRSAARPRAPPSPAASAEPMNPEGKPDPPGLGASVLLH